MQDVGSKKDMELNSEDLSLSSRELPVETLGHSQSVGNWIAPSSVIKALHGHSRFRFLFVKKTSCQRADNHSIRWTLRTRGLVLSFRPFSLTHLFPITS